MISDKPLAVLHIDRYHYCIISQRRLGALFNPPQRS
jgi:hypothetical protein